MKACIACAEEIQSAAKLCKHCGTRQDDLTFEDQDPNRAQETSKFGSVPTKSDLGGDVGGPQLKELLSSPGMLEGADELVKARGFDLALEERIIFLLGPVVAKPGSTEVFTIVAVQTQCFVFKLGTYRAVSGAFQPALAIHQRFATESVSLVGTGATRYSVREGFHLNYYDYWFIDFVTDKGKEHLYFLGISHMTHQHKNYTPFESQSVQQSFNSGVSSLSRFFEMRNFGLINSNPTTNWGRGIVNVG